MMCSFVCITGARIGWGATLRKFHQPGILPTGKPTENKNLTNKRDLRMEFKCRFKVASIMRL